MASFAKTQKTVTNFNIYYLLGIKGSVFGKWIIIISTFPKCKLSKGTVWKKTLSQLYYFLTEKTQLDNLNWTDILFPQ